MTSQELLIQTLNHKQPERVVFDMGSSAVTGIHVRALENLRNCFMSRFIDAGFDIINPVQVNAKGMDPKILKARYGKDLTFWGGGIDTQKTLPGGTPEHIREEVLRHCDIFAKDGGFVFNTVHNIQADVPVKNLVAMINALHEFNK
jgi:uroporphyrinogen-III decarboxylase